MAPGPKLGRPYGGHQSGNAASYAEKISFYNFFRHHDHSLPKAYFLYDRSPLSELSRFGGDGSTKGYDFGEGHRDPCIWAFLGIPSPLPRSLHGRVLLWQGGFSTSVSP
jgi:hypothetical protein